MRVWAEIMGLNSDWISNNDRVPAQKRNIAAGYQTVQIVKRRRISTSRRCTTQIVVA